MSVSSTEHQLPPAPAVKEELDYAAQGRPMEHDADGIKKRDAQLIEKIDQIAERDKTIVELQSQINSLNHKVAKIEKKLASSIAEKDSAVDEVASLKLQLQNAKAVAEAQFNEMKAAMRRTPRLLHKALEDRDASMKAAAARFEQEKAEEVKVEVKRRMQMMVTWSENGCNQSSTPTVVAPSETPSEVGVDDAKTAIIVKKEEKKYEKVGEKKKDEKRDEKAKEKKLLVTNDEEVIPNDGILPESVNSGVLGDIDNDETAESAGGQLKMGETENENTVGDHRKETGKLPGDQQKPAESGDENDDDTTMKPQLSEHSDEDTEMGEEEGMNNAKDGDESEEDAADGMGGERDDDDIMDDAGTNDNDLLAAVDALVHGGEATGRAPIRATRKRTLSKRKMHGGISKKSGKRRRRIDTPFNLVHANKLTTLSQLVERTLALCKELRFDDVTEKALIAMTPGERQALLRRPTSRKKCASEYGHLSNTNIKNNLKTAISNMERKMREKVAVDAAEKDGANEESNQQSLAMTPEPVASPANDVAVILYEAQRVLSRAYFMGGLPFKDIEGILARCFAALGSRPNIEELLTQNEILQKQVVDDVMEMSNVAMRPEDRNELRRVMVRLLGFAAMAGSYEAMNA
ncbi:hypothetical protein PRIPAC_77779 [Pristionchus pacificus]|uniref:Uncharacterized protein n=1 Tax=Pristionchus pacificus TaxID=54126 RepID=A0A2A6BWS1_PRIPA|nr:hypothetical protein PRIPAC_77779 [Pristionchus pacificus]|eukprot:PDM70339.1 hypothetical protein PRIPAC_46585 [Pristionchus pacificus]